MHDQGFHYYTNTSFKRIKLSFFLDSFYNWYGPLIIEGHQIFWQRNSLKVLTQTVPLNDKVVSTTYSEMLGSIIRSKEFIC